jgi:predicted anti-sigma-YlaC factor YlaD
MTGQCSNHACERTRAQVSLRLDGELSPFEDAELRVHLAACLACAAYEDQVRTFTRVVQAAPLEPPESSFVLPRRQRLSLGPVRVAVAAAVVAAVGLGGGLGVLRSDVLFRAPGGTESTGTAAQRSLRPAYLDSADYELRLIAQLRDARRTFRTGRPIPQ